MRLLVAVDLQSEAAGTVDEAARWASALGATIDLMFVDDQGATADYLKDEELRGMVLREWDAYRVRYEVQLKMLQMRMPQGVRGNVIVERGRPAKQVVAMAVDYSAIVVGTHRRRGVQRLLMGSVAETIVRMSPVPVLVAPIDLSNTAQSS